MSSLVPKNIMKKKFAVKQKAVNLGKALKSAALLNPPKFNNIELHSNKQKLYLNYEEHFAGAKTEKTSAGKTASGSGKNKITKKTFQIKKSIKDTSFIKKTRAYHLDTENFGEIIASNVGRVVTNSSEKGLELVPEVFLVHDDINKRFLAASHYLEKPMGDHLDDYAYEKGFNKKLKEKDPHVKISFINDTAVISRNNKDDQHVSSLKDHLDDSQLEKEEKALLRKDIADALAVSVLTGGHLKIYMIFVTLDNNK